jgi:hypothetical protein
MSNEKSASEPETGKASLESGCTQAFALGLTSLLGNMNGQCVYSPITYWAGFVKLVIPETGNRYLMVGDGGVFPLMNEKGILLSGGGRIARQFAPYTGTHQYRSKTELLRICNNAAEFVKTWSEDHAKFGSLRGSICTLVVNSTVRNQGV